MGSKLNLTNVTSGYQQVSVVNDNNTLIENAVDNQLSRDGSAPNAMMASLDMNNYNIINVKGLEIPDDLTVDNLTVNFTATILDIGTAQTLGYDKDTPTVDTNILTATTISEAIKELDAAIGVQDYGGMYDDIRDNQPAKPQWNLTSGNWEILNTAAMQPGDVIWTNFGGDLPNNGTPNNVTKNTTNGTLTLETEGLWEISYGVTGDGFYGDVPLVGFTIFVDGLQLEPVHFVQLPSSGADTTHHPTMWYDNTGEGAVVIDIRGKEYSGSALIELTSVYLFAKRIRK